MIFFLLALPIVSWQVPYHHHITREREKMSSTPLESNKSLKWAVSVSFCPFHSCLLWERRLPLQIFASLGRCRWRLTDGAHFSQKLFGFNFFCFPQFPHNYIWECCFLVFKQQGSLPHFSSYFGMSGLPNQNTLNKHKQLQAFLDWRIRNSPLHCMKISPCGGRPLRNLSTTLYHWIKATTYGIKVTPKTQTKAWHTFGITLAYFCSGKFELWYNWNMLHILTIP